MYTIYFQIYNLKFLNLEKTYLKDLNLYARMFTLFIVFRVVQTSS